MSSTEYEAGDINTVDEDDTDLDDEFEDDEVGYEDGDVNTVAGQARDDDDGDDDAGDDDDGQEGAGSATAVLRYLARAMSDDPDAVVIRSESQRNGVRLRLHVAPDDMGRVIGRRGRTAQAIRTLVGVAGARDGVPATVDIVDD